MNLSRLITGLVFASFGLFIIYEEHSLGSFITGAVFIVIGIIILLNKKEDEIEEIKSSGGKNKK